MEGKRAEIRVEGEYDPVLLLSPAKQHFVIRPGTRRLSPVALVPVLPKSLHDGARDVLINEESHQDFEAVLSG